jgi:hypothetical protein
MPEISTFLGIRITMYPGTREHPPAHFHAQSGSHRAVISIATGKILAGSLTTRAHRNIIEWWRLHQAELEENWRLARACQPLKEIDPL